MKSLIFYIILAISFSATGMTPYLPIASKKGQPASDDKGSSEIPGFSAIDPPPVSKENPSEGRVTNDPPNIGTKPKEGANIEPIAKTPAPLPTRAEGDTEPKNPTEVSPISARSPNGDKGATKTESAQAVFLENTHIGKAVIEGDIKKYQVALEELKTIFGIDIPDLLTKKTSAGKTLDVLMITSKQNKEYFNIELIHFLTIDTMRSITSKLDQSKVDSYRNKIDKLTKIAKEANNLFAVQLLTDFDTVTTKMYQTERKRQLESAEAFVVAHNLQTDLEKAEQGLNTRLNWAKTVLEITTAPEYNVNLMASGIIRFILSGTLLLTGMNNLFDVLDPSRSSMPISTDLAERITRYSEIPITPEATLFGLGAILVTAGTLGVFSGYKRCQRAFQKNNTIKTIQNLLNSAT